MIPTVNVPLTFGPNLNLTVPVRARRLVLPVHGHERSGDRVAGVRHVDDEQVSDHRPLKFLIGTTRRCADSSASTRA